MRFLKTKNDLTTYIVLIIATVIVTLSSSYLYKKISSISIEGEASVQLLSTLSMTQETEMAFGDITVSPTGGTVILSNSSDTVVCPAEFTCSGTSSRSKINIVGNSGTLNISYVNGVLSDGSNTITLDVAGSSANNYTSLSISGGETSLYIGAAITLNSSHRAGYYDTSNSGGSAYTVTVDY